MIVTLGGIVAELVGDSVEPWVGVVSLVLAFPPIVLAGARIFPAAVSLGQEAGDAAERSRTARYIHRTHWFCWVQHRCADRGAARVGRGRLSPAGSTSIPFGPCGWVSR